MESPEVVYEVEDQVAWITINRPEVRNALASHTYVELAEAVDRAAEDPGVGVIVLQGAGDRAFSSGGDVKGQGRRGPAEGRVHLHKALRLAAALRSCGKPTIAAVRGYCIGAGHELHLLCDLTIAADNAVFGQVGPRVGMCPVVGATQILPRLVGEKKAREMIFTTRFYTAEQALQMGLVNDVVPLADLAAAVRSLCDEMLVLSPQSLRIAKVSMNHAVDAMWPSFTEGVELLAMAYGTEEQIEGSRAFAEKRKPAYREMRARRAAGSETENRNENGA